MIEKLIHKLNLNDRGLVNVDDSGKSIACFAMKNNVAIDNGTIEQLKVLSKELGDKNIRICLHKNRSDNLHNMINLICKKNENTPHKHTYKSECYHIIEGQMVLSIYDYMGNILEECLLDENNTFIFRMSRDTYHSTIPKSKYVIFHETRSGPFPKDGDSTYLKI